VVAKSVPWVGLMITRVAGIAVGMIAEVGKRMEGWWYGYWKFGSSHRKGGLPEWPNSPFPCKRIQEKTQNTKTGEEYESICKKGDALDCSPL